MDCILIVFAGRLECAFGAPVAPNKICFHVAGGFFASVMTLNSQPPIDFLDVEVGQAELCLQRSNVRRKFAVVNAIDFIGASFFDVESLDEA